MTQRIDLNGTWHLRFDDGERGGPASRLFGPDADLSLALAAQVPGEVHLDLIRAGLLAEPNEGLNVLAARWVEETHWHYRRQFEAPALEPGERAVLVLETVQLNAVVTLNGREVGRHHNVFYPCRLDVTDALLAGTNVLVVNLEAGLFGAGDKPAAGYGAGKAVELHKRQWLRQTQSQAGWDWSPRLFNVGLSGPVTLEISSAVRVEQTVVLAELDPDLTTGHVTVRLIAHGLAAEPQAATLRVWLPELGLDGTAEVQVAPGEQRLELTLEVPAPELWWPVGHGAPRRYLVRTKLLVNGAVVARDERQIGFRHVRVNQEPHPDGGRHFVLEINGRPIFCKGGNLVPADLIPARIEPERYATLVDRALEANFNFLRIWGGGLYEADAFYDECDARGVLVWQEFIFACSKYPVHDAAFLADVEREARYQIRRLASRPSLVVWCGNNELEWGAVSWGYAQGVAHPDYALFHLTLPRLLKAEDGTRYYQPSSPYSPDLEDPNADHTGDQHPWSVGFHDTDFRKYRQMISRFPNEGGILGSTALPTLRACLPAGQARPLSFAFEQHDNSVAYWGPHDYPSAMVEQWTGRRVADLDLEGYAYWAGLTQGEGLREYIDNFRRRMFSSASAIFWMYNDCWPATRSWTIVDYYLRRTPAFWAVRRAMAPVTVVVADEGERLGVYGINETREPVAAELRYGVLALAGGYPWDQAQAVELAPNAATRLATLTRAQWDAVDPGQTGSAAFASLTRAGQLLARHRLFLPYFRELRWPAAEVSVRLEAGCAVFESPTFAWGVCLDLTGEVRLADNLFDVWPGEPLRLPWPGEAAPVVLHVGNLSA